jgi:predicted dehydrogenase
MPNNVLIVGLGQIGMEYDLALDPAMSVYSHARAFSLHPAFKLSGAVDPAETQREIFESHYGQPAYSNIENALKVGDAGVVVIAASTVEHYRVLRTVLAHSKPKAILCEKPLAYDLAEARQMVEACDCAGVKLFVNYVRRADPGAIDVKKRIESTEIAGPIKGFAWYSKGFLHNGSHFFNLFEFWLGAFIKAKVLDSGNRLDSQDPEPDVHVEFERGKVIFMAAWEEAFSHHTIELLSHTGRLRYEQGGEYIAWQPSIPDSNFSGYKVLKATPEIIENGMNRYQWNVVNQLSDALADKQNNLCTGRQALATLESMHQIINQR